MKFHRLYLDPEFYIGKQTPRPQPKDRFWLIATAVIVVTFAAAFLIS